MTSSSFVPKGQEGLLVRSPFAFGFPQGNTISPKSIYSNQTDKSEMLDEQQRDILSAGGTPRKVGYYTRNNPHAGRVRLMKGLVDSPICYVEDNTERQRPPSAPSGRDFGQGFRPPGSTRYGSNTDKDVAAVGVVPITYQWRDELERKAQHALSRALGQPSSRGSLASRSGSRQPPHQFDQVDDRKILDLMCRILQTESIPACQAWLSSASNDEKNIVLNMIRMATTGELDSKCTASRPQTSDSQYPFAWKPDTSQARKPRQQKPEQSGEFDFTYGDKQSEAAGTEEEEKEEASPFRFPEHDTVIKTARQLSNLASRQSARARSLDFTEMRNRDFTSMDPKSIAKQLASASSGSKPHHPRSASLSGPQPTGKTPFPNKRPRSRSAGVGHVTRPIAGGSAVDPTAPIKVSVTKETIRAGSANSGKSRHRYTSHWNA